MIVAVPICLLFLAVLLAVAERHGVWGKRGLVAVTGVGFAEAARPSLLPLRRRRRLLITDPMARGGRKTSAAAKANRHPSDAAAISSEFEPPAPRRKRGGGVGGPKLRKLREIVSDHRLEDREAEEEEIDEANDVPRHRRRVKTTKRHHSRRRDEDEDEELDRMDVDDNREMKEGEEKMRRDVVTDLDRFAYQLSDIVSGHRTHHNRRGHRHHREFSDGELDASRHHHHHMVAFRKGKKVADINIDIEDVADTGEGGALALGKDEVEALPSAGTLVEREGVPKNFYAVWRGIQAMRTHRDAPVDVVGTHALGDRSQPKPVWRFQTLVAAMLSSQTKDEATADAMERLKKHGLTIEGILNTPQEELSDILKGVGFHNTKARNIRRVAEILKTDYKGDIPDTYEGLSSLPGVGPKMTHLVLATAWGRVEGIVVDVHVHRIANRLGWIKTSTPEQTRHALEAFVPKDMWADFTTSLVGFGQQMCRAVHPVCESCAVRTMCPTGRMRTPNLKLGYDDW